MVFDVVVKKLGLDDAAVVSEPAFVGKSIFPGFLGFQVRITGIYLVVIVIKCSDEITEVELTNGAFERASELRQIIEIPAKIETRFDVSKRSFIIDVDAGLFDFRIFEIQRTFQSDVLSHLPEMRAEKLVSILLDVRVRVKNIDRIKCSVRQHLEQLHLLIERVFGAFDAELKVLRAC